MALALYVVFRCLSWAITAYIALLFVRAAIDWVRFFARDWRPPLALMTIFNLVYALTDPPIRAANRLVPPARIGVVALDLGFFIVFIALVVGRSALWMIYGILVSALR